MWVFVSLFVFRFYLFERNTARESVSGRERLLGPPAEPAAQKKNNQLLREKKGKEKELVLTFC